MATVPPLVCAVQVTVAGAPGGAGRAAGAAPAGGAGALVTATMVVTPGQVLDAEVAGAGQAAGFGTLPKTLGHSGGYAGDGGAGGGGGGGIDAQNQNEAGGGGGASMVSSGGTPLVVAGGGGGGGAVDAAVGGAGGMLGDYAGAGAGPGGGRGGSPAGGVVFEQLNDGGGTQPTGTGNAGNGKVGGGGDGAALMSGGGPSPVDQMGGQGTGAPGSTAPATGTPIGAGGPGNTTGGDAGEGGYDGTGGAGGGGGVGFGGGAGSDGGGGGGGWQGGSGTYSSSAAPGADLLGGGGGGSSYVAPSVAGGSSSSTLTTGEVTVTYDLADDLCGQTVFYASATAQPGSGGGATPADPCDLSEALLRVPAGGTVILVTAGGATASSRYVGNWTVATPGTTAQAPVTIEALPGLATQPILDGGGPGAPPGEVCQTHDQPGAANAYGYQFNPCSKVVLSVPSGVDVTLQGTTVADAKPFDSSNGGGLDAEGLVTVRNDSFTADVASTALNGTGGAIFVGAAGSVSVTSSTFTHNSAGPHGGAIDNTDGGQLSVSSSTFTDNTSNVGGAIDSYNPTQVTGSTFTGNSAADGGAIYGYGVSVTGSAFTGNNATDGGGAIDLNGDYQQAATVASSTFTDNTTSGYGGGAILSDANQLVTDSSFTGNTATGGGGLGGAIYAPALTVQGSTFSADAATEGGAILSSAFSLTVTDSTFDANTATAGGAIDASDNNDPFYGGSPSHGTVVASTFTGNTAAHGPSIDNGDHPSGSPASTLEVAADIFDGACDQVSGTWVDDGYNAATSPTCFSAQRPATDVLAAQLDLAPLAANGGPTETNEPALGSPAIGIIPTATTTTVDGTQTALCPTVDQRGIPSIPGTPCNAGSVQTATAVTPPVSVPEVPDPALLALPAATIGGLVLYKRRRRHP